jgi:alanine racemase
MPRPILATIHGSALTHNLQQARRRAVDARVWAVVKANAYGHGVPRVYEALRGADGFALLDLQEAEVLRALGWRGPILLLEGCFDPRDLDVCSRLDLWHVVHHEQQIDWLAAHKTKMPHRVFLKMNSGMNRLGFAPHSFRSAWHRLNGLTQVDEISLMTHFADADSPLGFAAAQFQVECFVRETQDLPGERSLSNSAATLALASLHPEIKADWVRAGIMLYGSSPQGLQAGASAADWQLQATMSLNAQLIATQTLSAGETVGYGRTFTAPEAMRIGVVACGYADGYPRHAPTNTPVLVNGQRTRLVGRVSMDMLTVDLNPLPQAQVGDAVTLWGHAPLPQAPLLPIDEVAHHAGTISYELMCALAPRVPVEWVP